MGVDPGYADEDGKETVVDWRCHPDCAVRHLAMQSGESGAAARAKGSSESTRAVYGAYARRSHVFHDDTGTAARFFPQAGWDAEVAEALLSGPGAYYTPKPSPKERDAGLSGFPLQSADPYAGHRGRRMLDGSSRFDGEPVRQGRNIHPTVKPVALAEWLATLLLPPAQYGPRRLLVPFAGSGSEGLGAMMAGWERVTLIEQSLDYCALAANRLAWWWPRVRQGMTEVKAVLDTWHKSDGGTEAEQVSELPLFAGISNPSFQTAIR
jgi:hypothetical protein